MDSSGQGEGAGEAGDWILERIEGLVPRGTESLAPSQRDSASCRTTAARVGSNASLAARLWRPSGQPHAASRSTLSVAQRTPRSQAQAVAGSVWAIAGIIVGGRPRHLRATDLPGPQRRSDSAPALATGRLARGCAAVVRKWRIYAIREFQQNTAHYRKTRLANGSLVSNHNRSAGWNSGEWGGWNTTWTPGDHCTCGLQCHPA